MRTLRVVRGKSIDFLMAGSHVVAFNDDNTGWICESGWEDDVREYIKRTQDVRFELPPLTFSKAVVRRVLPAPDQV